MEAKLIRLTSSRTLPQRGVFVLNGEPLVVTLELPWAQNRPRVSCIPEGRYECQKVWNRSTIGGLKIPETFEVKLVPERSGILFHVGNVAKDSNGCILVGSKFGELNKAPAVLESREAFIRFCMALKAADSFSMDVLWAI